MAVSTARARTPRAVHFHKIVFRAGIATLRHLRAGGVKDDATVLALRGRMRAASRAHQRAARTRA